jgi:hypothetical protein
MILSSETQLPDGGSGRTGRRPEGLLGFTTLQPESIAGFGGFRRPCYCGELL